MGAESCIQELEWCIALVTFFRTYSFTDFPCKLLFRDFPYKSFFTDFPYKLAFSDFHYKSFFADFPYKSPFSDFPYKLRFSDFPYKSPFTDSLINYPLVISLQISLYVFPLLISPINSLYYKLSFSDLVKSKESSNSAKSIRKEIKYAFAKNCIRWERPMMFNIKNKNKKNANFLHCFVIHGSENLYIKSVMIFRSHLATIEYKKKVSSKNRRPMEIHSFLFQQLLCG